MNTQEVAVKATLAGLFSLALSMSVFAQPVAQMGCHAVTKKTCDLAASLKRGVNFGGMLESPREGDWGARLEPKYIDIAATKFQTVRIPVKWTNRASSDADATIDPFFRARVDKAVEAALGKNLNVIINVHAYDQLFGRKTLLPYEKRVAEDVLEERLVNIWRQLATHYKSRPQRLVFELLNEPNGAIDADKWNVLLNRLVRAIREIDAERVLMIGPTSWGSSKALSTLKLPADRNIIATFHSYAPFEFTHQGATWLPLKLPLGVSCCNGEQKRAIEGEMLAASQWSRQSGIPVHLGEFGSYNKGDLESRAAYTRLVRSSAERFGIGWAVWDFVHAFGVYDPRKEEWIGPLHDALFE